MGLDEQLADLLKSLGVTLEDTTTMSDAGDQQARRENDGDERGRRASHDMARSRERSRGQGQGQGRAEMHEMTGRDQQSEQAEQAANPLEETMSAYQHPGDWEDEDDDMMAQAELSLFQTSREHYGVFYRLDLVGGAPHLRVFAPDEEGALKMRCYLVRASIGAPLRDWFGSTRAHNGSDAFGASRETIEQHLLFAAGEALKRLFWSGEPERMRFPWEIEVERVA
jgi:hypothetical protein